MLNLLWAFRRVAFQNELVMSGEAAGRKIEGSKSRNLRSEALFEIGQLNVAATPCAGGVTILTSGKGPDVQSSLTFM
jgi:hypothetical protein